MFDGSAQISQFTLTTNTGQQLGPFTLPDTTQAYRFEVDISDTIQSLRLDAAESTGGNTGLVEFAIYTRQDAATYAFWPPPWNEKRVQQVLETLETVSASSSSISGLPLAEEFTDLMRGWSEVAQNPQPFLSLGLVTEKWLELALPILLQNENGEALKGDSLLHFDLRSDNMCFVDDRVVLIDWNGASYGNRLVDIAGWLSSLHSEGGPLPEQILPNAPELATLMSGFFASKAGLPIIPDAPYVREVQKSQLSSALPWVIRALKLPPADGSLMH